jgi:fibronectin-binding autotransporter adhesin
LAGGTTVNSITFNSFTGTYTLGTSTQTITLNNGITMNSGAGAATIISPITLGAAQSWTNNDDSLLTIGTGAVTNGGFLLTVGGTGNTTVSSVIGGLGGLTKTGAGLLTLSGANTFAGQLTVQNGTLSINTINNESADGTLGNSASSVILGNTGAQTGTLQYTGATASSTKKFTLATGGTGAFEVTTGATTLSLTGLIDGDGGLTKIGAGTLTLSNTNTYTGATTVNAGTLKLDFSAAGAPATNIISSSSALTLGGGTTLNGTTLNLTGKASTTNSQAFNGTTINPGVSAITLTANATANPLSLNLGAITRNVGSVLRITLPTGTRSATNGVLTTSGTAGQILLSNGVAYATIGNSDWAGMDATNTFLAPPTYTAATPTSLSGNASLNTMNGTTTLSSNTTITSLRAAMSRFYTVNINAGVTLTTGGILVGSGVDDGGIFNINGPGSLRGPAGQDLVFINHPVGITRVHPTTISAPIVDNVSATGFTYSGLGGAGSSATGEPLSLTGTNTYTGTTRILGGTFSIGNGGTTGSLDPSSQIVNNASLIINRSNDLTFSNSISGTGTLTKSGAGKLLLSGTNTYTGTTTINAGTLQLAKQVSLYNNATASWTAANISVKSGGTLAFNVGGTGEFTTGDFTTLLTNLAASSSATNGMNAGSSFGFDTTNASGGTFTIADVIANSTGTSGGARGLTKLGTGTLVLSNTNTYTGATNVSAGTLQLDGSTHASSTANIGTAGTLTGTGTINGNATLTGGGIINKSSGTIAGTLGVTGGNWNGNGTVTGLVTSSSGTFTIGNGANLTATSGVSATGGALVVNGTLTGTLDANSSTIVSGTGTVTGNATISGIHSPGNSPGIQSYGSNLSYTTGSSVTWELAADTLGVRGTDFDGIDVGGALDFAGSTTINLNFNLLGSTVDWADTFWDTSHTGVGGWLVYDVAGSLNNFGNLSLGSSTWLDSLSNPFSGTGGTFSLAQSGSDVVLNYTVIPEPNVAALIGGFGVLALLRRRR